MDERTTPINVLNYMNLTAVIANWPVCRCITCREEMDWFKQRASFSRERLYWHFARYSERRYVVFWRRAW